MAQIETWLNQDMMQAVKVRYLDGNLFSQDNAGNLIGVKLTRDGEDYSGGGTVSANVIRADGGTVAVTGALSGNAATVVLPQSAYAVPGVVSIVVKLTVSGAIITIAAVVANIYQSSTETAIDPGTIIPSIQTLINQINTAVASIPADYSSLWETLAPAFSTSTAYTIGQYVTYDGGLYRFTSAHPAGAWSSSDTTAAVVGNVFTDLQTGKADKTDPVFYGTISKGRKGNSQAGTGSVALGDNVTANGWFSQAEGQGTIANGSYQRASGKYNVADTGNTYAEMVGNGYAEVDPQTFAVTEHRSNARTLDWNGNETLAGDLTVNKGTANEVTLGAEVSNLKNDFEWYSNDISSEYTVLTDMYIDGSTHYLRVGAGSDRTICIHGEANKKYILHKDTATVVRIGCGNTPTPSNQTYVLDYVTNGTASNNEIEFKTRADNPYIYIQLFVDGDSSSYKSISANVGSLMVIPVDETINGIAEELETVFDVLSGDLGIVPSVETTLTSNTFINATNNQIATSSGFVMTAPITIKRGQIITVTAHGYLTNVGIIAVCNSDNTERQVVVPSIDSDLHDYIYTAVNDGYVVCSFNGTEEYNISLSGDYVSILGLQQSVNSAVDKINNQIQYPQFFDKIICMGDSLTQGQSGGSASVPLVKNYPHFIEKLTQAEITNQSQGGITTEGFWTTYASSYDYTSFDCAIIFLGTNGGLTNSVDTDCHADYTQNADTQTGYYGRIIGRIKATAPNCRIFLVAGVNDYVRRATTMNPAVRALASFYNVGLVDIENCIMSDNGGSSTIERWLYRPVDGIHYNALGYMTMANMIYDRMSQFMSENRTMYDDYSSN